MKALRIAVAAVAALTCQVADPGGLRFAPPAASAMPAGVTIRDRMASRWRSLDATSRALGDSATPADWDAGLFLSADAIGTLLDQLVGSQIRHKGGGFLYGTVVEVTGVKLKPHTGALDADLDLVAKSNGVALPLSVAATVSFEGVAPPEPGKAPLMTLRVDPVDVRPNTGLGVLDAAAGKLVDNLLPDLARLLADRDVFDLKVPVPDHIDIPLGLEKRDTMKVNDGNGTVSYEASMPAGMLTQGIGYLGPVFTERGVWLRASIGANRSGPQPAAPPTGTGAKDLAARVAELEAALARKLAAMPTPATGTSFHLGKSVILSLADKLHDLSPALRRVDLKTTGQSGPLAGHRQSLGVLGNLGVQAFLIDKSGVGSIDFTFDRGRWGEQGFTMPITAAMRAKASVELNIDVIASGLVRTSVGLVGDGTASMTPSAAPLLIGAGERRVAVLKLSGTCTSARADVRTDGQLKTDFGWTKVPSVGGRISAPLGPIPPLRLLDGRRRFLRLPERALGDWLIVPGHAAVEVAVTPTSLTHDGAGVDLAVEIASEAVPIAQDSPTRDGDLNAAEARSLAQSKAVASATDDELRDLARTDVCHQTSEFALLLGDLEFGGNNDLVKVLVFVGKLPAAAVKEAERLGHEASVEKIKGWIDNPRDAFARGEVGRQIGHAAHEASPEKVKGWVQNPGDSLRRGEAGRAVCHLVGC